MTVFIYLMEIPIPGKTIFIFILRRGPGGRINKKISSYQYRKSHCGDKTILRPSYLHSGISYTGKMTSLYWIRAQVSILHMPLSHYVISCYNRPYYKEVPLCFSRQLQLSGIPSQDYISDRINTKILGLNSSDVSIISFYQWAFIPLANGKFRNIRQYVVLKVMWLTNKFYVPSHLWLLLLRKLTHD